MARPENRQSPPGGATHNAQRTHAQRVEDELQSRISEDDLPLLTRFTQRLWARALEEDLASRDPADDAGATLACWRQFVASNPGEFSIYLHNPVAARDGWKSAHSIVIIAAPDMPFVVDSVLMALSHDGLSTHQLNNIVLGVDRDPDGAIAGLSADMAHANRELLIYAEVDRLDDEQIPRLHEKLTAAMIELRAVVDDFAAMKARIAEEIEQLRQTPPPLPSEALEEGIAFLQWLLSNHFTFLGVREFSYEGGHIRQIGDALGVHRTRPPASERKLADHPARARDFLLAKTLLSFSKSGTKSRVHRPAYPDYVGIKKFDAQGEVVGEIGLSGLYTSRAYMELPENIPSLRSKVANVMARSGLDPNGFDGKVFAQVLATYPRDELFQIDEDQLLETASIITDIHERRRVRVFHRFDPYGLFVTSLVYMPRDLFSTTVRERLYDMLVDIFGAEGGDHDILLSESTLVRVQFTLRIKPGHQVEVDRRSLERQINEMIVDWRTELTEELQAELGARRGRALALKYANAFTAGYQEHFRARTAVHDIEIIESLSSDKPLLTHLYRLPESPREHISLKLFHLGNALPLSDVVPKLEHLGLTVISEHPYTVQRNGAGPVAVHDYELCFEKPLDLGAIAGDFDDAFTNIWHQRAQDDGFNRLILQAGLNWRQVSVIRAYAQYMKQIRFGFSQLFISNTLYRHAELTADLVALFESRLSPDLASDSSDQGQTIAERIRFGLDQVELLNEDRILRRMLELIEATLRTNYYVTDGNGQPRTFLSLKLDPSHINDMPRPKPRFEIFVSAPHFEGVHLRGGSVARGGLRWSDRLEDYRTEVLGLVKAQVVKNAVIVPTGAKGGFVVKGDVPGEACYQDFIRGLLDVTDNVIDGVTCTPARVRALDEPDPYLVVAADKGTATFSDIANGIAEDYGFWLGDAFASGGSNGYDHKKMGITARGGWISVQRHFAERGIDVQNESVTVLGIGDMAGDVFGNGMLLSQQIKLVAAFNHRHIFIDPDPDPQSSFAERKRLFELPRSSWEDYDSALISPGGGVFSRGAKSVQLTPQMQSLFDIAEQQLSPDELIHRLLSSPVQLIWNGGVGTYVKSSRETHDEVGDRANDTLRVNAADLRCQVFGEGGNLGMTQMGRVEFGLMGGSVNTDFIDNSAGVDCSDHEVNIKIALNVAVASEDMTRKQRNELLEDMTDVVADLVLANNFNQAQTLSLAQRHATSHASEYQRLIGFLSQQAGLDRALEFLPSDEELAERHSRGDGLTRPELAVLLAYSKIHAKTALSASDVESAPLLAKRLFTCFPPALRDNTNVDLRQHPLAREITITQLVNEMVDRMGPSYVAHLITFMGANARDIATAYAVVAEVYEFDALYNQIADSTQVAALSKLSVLAELARLGRRASRHMLRLLATSESVDNVVTRLSAHLQGLIAARDGSVGERGDAWRQRVATLQSEGFEESLARRCAFAADLANLVPVIERALQHNSDPLALAELNVRVGHDLHIDWLAGQLVDHACASHWQEVQRESLLDVLFERQIAIACAVLQQGGGQVQDWLQMHAGFADAWFSMVNEARGSAQPDLAMFTVLVNKLQVPVAG